MRGLRSTSLKGEHAPFCPHTGKIRSRAGKIRIKIFFMDQFNVFLEPFKILFHWDPGHLKRTTYHHGKIT